MCVCIDTRVCMCVYVNVYTWVHGEEEGGKDRERESSISGTDPIPMNIPSAMAVIPKYHFPTKETSFQFWNKR